MGDAILYMAPTVIQLHQRVEAAIESHCDPDHILALADELQPRPALPTGPVGADVAELNARGIAAGGLRAVSFACCLQHFILLKAVDAAHVSLVNRILSSGTYVLQDFANHPFFISWSPFHLACLQGNKAVTDCFIPQRPNLNTRGGRPGKNFDRDLSALELLLRHDDAVLMENWWPEIDRHDEQQLLPAHVAIEVGALNCFLHIVENYPSWLDRWDEDGFPAFMHAARRGPSFYEMLLDRTDFGVSYGQDRENALHALFKFSYRPQDRFLPLHAPTTAAILIDKGCDVNGGRSPPITHLYQHLVHLQSKWYNYRAGLLEKLSCTGSREEAPDGILSLSELRITVKSSLQVLLEKGSSLCEQSYYCHGPALTAVTSTLSEYLKDSDDLDAQEEVATTVAYFCEVADMFLSHGAVTKPCVLFCKDLLSEQTRETDPGHGELVFTKRFVQLQPVIRLFLNYGVNLLGEKFFGRVPGTTAQSKRRFIQHVECFRLKIPFYTMAINASPHRQYYRALELLRETASVMAEVISDAEQEDIVGGLTEDAAILEQFIARKEKQVRPLKHITRLRISDLLGRRLTADISHIPIPPFLRDYILSYEN